MLLWLAAAVCAISALLSARSAGRAIRRMLAAQALASVAFQRAADEEAGKETALRLLEEQRLARLAEYEQYSARLSALQSTYEGALDEYRAAIRAYRERLALEDADDSPLTH